MIIRVAFLAFLLLLGGCSDTLSPSDWGGSAAGVSPKMLAIVAMPSPHLDEPLEGNLVPTAYLARVAAEYLKERREIGLVDVTGSSAGTSEAWGEFDMQRHLSLQRDWWRADTGQADYSSLRQQGVDGVIEIVIGNYEISLGGLVMQVMVKLIDPTTGSVLGKARAGAYEKVEPQTIEQFKLIFARSGRMLVVDNLQRIGL